MGVISFQLWVALDSFPFKRWSVTKKNPFDFGQIEEKKINLLVKYSGRSLEKKLRLISFKKIDYQFTKEIMILW